MSARIWLAPAVALAVAPLSALAQVESIEQALERVTAVGEPPFDPLRKPEPGYIEAYKAAQHELCRQKAAILLEACRRFPDDPRTPGLMDRRWVLLGWNQNPAAVADEVLADIDQVLPAETHPDVLRHGAYWRAFYTAHRLRPDADAMMAAAESFLARYPEDERGAALLMLVATEDAASPGLRAAAYRSLGAQYPATYNGRYAPGMLRQVEELGKPFELSFRDAVTGKEISVAGLRGRVVVIDFWATTCGPCVAEMPRLKQFYADFKDRGVEVIGVSLDEPEARGGLDAVKKFVRERQIPWPQYYQGDGYQSAFSKSWGVGGIPAVFVIDKSGRLRSTTARGELDELVATLLAEP